MPWWDAIAGAWCHGEVPLLNAIAGCHCWVPRWDTIVEKHKLVYAIRGLCWNKSTPCVAQKSKDLIVLFPRCRSWKQGWCVKDPITWLGTIVAPWQPRNCVAFMVTMMMDSLFHSERGLVACILRCVQLKTSVMPQRQANLPCFPVYGTVWNHFSTTYTVQSDLYFCLPYLWIFIPPPFHHFWCIEAPKSAKEHQTWLTRRWINVGSRSLVFVIWFSVCQGKIIICFCWALGKFHICWRSIGYIYVAILLFISEAKQQVRLMCTKWTGPGWQSSTGGCCL